jgi:hypothetical protein
MGGDAWNGRARSGVDRSLAPADVALVASRGAAGGLVMNQTASGPTLDRPDHSLILASRVNGTPVFDSAGKRIGHVDDLSIERVSGEVVYAIMSFGGFLGMGEKYHPLPWSLLDYDPERGGYVVALDKATLEAAPYYDPYELDKLGGPSRDAYGDRIFGYYNPYGGIP